MAEAENTTNNKKRVLIPNRLVPPAAVSTGKCLPHTSFTVSQILSSPLFPVHVSSSLSFP